MNGEREQTEHAAARARALLHLVKDPEVPVLSVVELGVVRDVAVTDGTVIVTLTPTYSGCPAMQVIESAIVSALRKGGFEAVSIKTVYAPAWTTDWISEPAREKLRAYGIAPPRGEASGPIALGATERRVSCPRCGSTNTVTISAFGATACKSLHQCQSCREPFEHFKEF